MQLEKSCSILNLVLKSCDSRSEKDENLYTIPDREGVCGEISVLVRGEKKMADENTPSATRLKKEKVNFTEDEIDVLVSLWSKEEVLFNCKHADYHKKDERNAATLRILKVFEL